ncbi:MAG: hypothetical protein LBH28_05770 [Oscillospiraceae bacterium]|jgi:hypothetical protein|nr:hypothetical protein [Oscillospiraceae bacterium]
MAAGNGIQLRQMAEFFEASAGDGKLAVTGVLTLTGGGGVLQLYGGTSEHVGSVTVSIPRPSLMDKDRTSVTSSVINLLSHKEELVGRPAAEMLAIALDRPVVCVAGIHVDEATNDELKLLTKHSEDVVHLLMQKLQK